MHEPEQDYPLHQPSPDAHEDEDAHEQEHEQEHGHRRPLEDKNDDDFLEKTEPVSRRSRRPLPQREEPSTPILPRNRLKNTLIAGLIAGVLCSVESILVAFANTSNYQQASHFSSTTLPYSLALTLLGVACLTFFVGLVICLIAGFVIGKVAVQRRLGFLTGFIAGIVTYGISFLLNYIPSYPGHLSGSSTSNAGIVVSGIFVILLLFLVWGIVAGLVSLFGTWLSTRRHPYYVGD